MGPADPEASVSDDVAGARGPQRAGSVQDAVAAAAERADRFDPMLGAFVCRFPEEAAATAKQLDGQDADGAVRGPLHGMLIAVKDLIAAREAPTSCQSRVYDHDWWAGRDSAVVERLRSAGAVIVGKTTMAEYGLARPDPTAGFPTPRNPWDLDRWPGGSSCGSANGLAAGLFTASLGTDSNGSVRIPAAMCGVTGIKPTYGLVPVSGCRPVSRSLDVIGPLARDARDCARVLAVLAGPAGPTRVPWRDGLAGIRIGVPSGVLAGAKLSDDCGQAFTAAIQELEHAGAEVRQIDLPETLPLVTAGLVTLLAEAFEVHREQLRQRWADFGRPFRRSVVLGAAIDAATYLRAQRVRGWASGRLVQRFSELDAIATPTWPRSAPRYDDPSGLMELSGLPGMWNSAGFPAIAVPMGMSPAGLPLSLQLAGPPWSDYRLAVIADAYQQRTSWHLCQPRLSDEMSSPPVAATQDGAGAAADDAALTRISDAMRVIGVPVQDAELPALSEAWSGISRLSGLLPDPAVEIGPLSIAHLAASVDE